MNYRELARKIKNGYKLLEEYNDNLHSVYCSGDIKNSNNALIPEIEIERNGDFKAIIIGNAYNYTTPCSKGYMYLFYSNDFRVPFPTIAEIERRLRIIANKGVLQDNNACYFSEDKLGNLETQREYFADVIVRALDTE